MVGARALARLRRGARGGHRPADRLPRQRRARRRGRPRRRRGAPPPARLPALARARRPSGSRRRAAARSSPASRRASRAASSRRRTAGRPAGDGARARPRGARRLRARRGGGGDRARRRRGDRSAHAPATIGAAGAWSSPRAPWSAALAPARRRAARAPGQGPDPRAAHARRDADAVRAAHPHAALLPLRRAATAGWCSARPSRSRASTPPSPPTASSGCSRRRGRCCPTWASSSWSGAAPACGRAPPTTPRSSARRARRPGWATGHYRNGVLLAPLTGDAVVAGQLAGRRAEGGAA